MPVYKHWLDYDVAALAFLIVGIAAVELIAINDLLYAPAALLIPANSASSLAQQGKSSSPTVAPAPKMATQPPRRRARPATPVVRW